MSKDVKEILKITNGFLKVPSVVGYEKPFLLYLEKKIKKLGYRTILKKNYLVIKPKKKDNDVEKKNVKYLFSTHIDRHGLICNDFNRAEFGAFYLKKKFELDFKYDLNIKKEEKLSDYFKLKGVNFNFSDDYLKFEDFNLKFEKEHALSFYEMNASRYVNNEIYSYDKNSGKKISSFKILRFDQNFKKKEIIFDLNKNLKGEVFAFKSKINLKNNIFFGQIDNVISVAVLYYILKNFDFNQEIIFTTGEEIGISYLNVLDYMKSKKNKLDVITLDTSPYENFEDKKVGFLTLRKGDENGKFNIELVNEIEKIATSNGINVSFKPSDKGMTELGRIVNQSKGEINGASIQIPTLNYHTNYETSTLESLENYMKLIKLLK